MAEFVGRNKELHLLERELDRVRTTTDAPGRCLLVRGRRRVGKSRLLEELCARTDTPAVFFTASQQGRHELAHFSTEVESSTLPGRDLFADTVPATWDAALRLLATALDASPAAIVVIDEFPYLVADDPSIEATFQKQWDRLLSKRHVLLVLIGSDLAMMEALNTHGRAFFQRGSELVVPPLSPIETATIVGAKDAASAFDAYLVTGGLPLVCADWPKGRDLRTFLRRSVDDPTSALIVSGERALAAEFPAELQARTVLDQIGAGERTFSNIARASGGLNATSLTRSLHVLATTRVVAREVPLSTRPSREARYRVADPYLRFWLRFIGPHLAEIERGRGDRVAARIERDWAAWRGRAIEPVVREALSLLGPLDDLPDTGAVGGYWTRTNVPEIDLIGADRGPIAGTIHYAGTIKWLDKQPLEQRDVDRLRTDLAAVPGTSSSTPLIAVSRRDAKVTGAAAVLGPDDLLAAWST